MYQVLSKDTITLEILPYLSVAKRGFTCKADITEVINGILYKLKTGIQWHILPVKALFSATKGGEPLAIKDGRNPVDGLFLNVDAAFDSEDFRNQCLSHGVFPNVCFNKRYGGYNRNELLIEELYRKRYIIERTNAWMDSFCSIFVRHDTTLTSWEAWNYIFFAVLLLRKC